MRIDIPRRPRTRGYPDPLPEADYEEIAALIRELTRNADNPDRD